MSEPAEFESPEIEPVRVGDSEAVMIPSERLIEELKRRGLLRADWEPPRRGDDGTAKKAD